MTFYQDQKRRQNWIYIPAALIMPKIWEEPLYLLRRIATLGGTIQLWHHGVFGSEMRPFLKDSCVGQRSCVYSTSRQFVLSCLPALLL